ncbi:MAG: peptidyl-prolyl cis-trans isomerase [Paludibacteraceae bacterium]|nr:peptidyl-prolyl cis-trans isomerase [Paludibacteraceae bacterium]
MFKTFLSIFLIASFVFSTCQKQNESFRAPVLKINNQYLYEDELPKNQHLNNKDSIAMVEKFEKNWVIDALMYEHALKNVDQKSIDLLVEEYRKSLIVQNYKQLLINQRLKDPSEEEISDYYEKYSSQFLLEDDIVKGIFVKVPKKADKLRKMRKWVEEFSVENIENMENYSVKNYGTLDFFTEYWVFEQELMKQLPTTIDIKLTPNKFFEMEDSVYVYMLNVLDYRKIGEIEPLDFAQDKIKNLLLNKQKIEFIRQFEEELYQQFKKDIMYFTSNKEEVEQ